MKTVPFQLLVEDTAAPGTAEVFSFKKERITIGRTKLNDLRLLNRYRAVSRQHAEIRQEAGAFHLVDLGSKNATRLNGRRLEPAQPYPLCAGDRFCVGDFEIEFTLGGGAPRSGVDLFQDDPASLLTKLYGGSRAGEEETSGDRTLQRVVEELIVLSELAFEIGGSFRLEDSIQVILRRTLEVMGAAQSLIVLFDERAPEGLRSFARIADPGQYAAPLCGALLRWMQQHRRPLRLDQTRPDRLPYEVPCDASVRTILCLPLVVRTRLIGVLAVYNRRSGEAFTEADERLLAVIAAQSAQVIENARLAKQAREVEQARALRRAYTALSETHQHLKTTQQQLIQQEKMASLGRLTAGIAHEIKNPLNFVTNFALLSEELVADLDRQLAAYAALPAPERLDDLRASVAELGQNAARISEHGRRADRIIRSMLEHSSGGRGERRAVDLNALLEEYVSLAYHGLRAQPPGLCPALHRDYAPEVGAVELVPQEIGRVFVNLLSNAFYALQARAREADASYAPALTVATRGDADRVEIRIADNGAGIPAEIRSKIFEPFFTTKPAGQGTGLGLSLSYDIVVLGHGGAIAVESEEGAGAAFVISLPRTPLRQDPAGAPLQDPPLLTT